MACSDVAHAEGCRGTIPYKFLMAVDLRRFGKGEQSGSADWTGGTVACAGGAIDYVVKVSVGSGVRLSGQGVEAATNAAREEFWRLAQRCKTATRDMVEKETIRWDRVWRMLFTFLMQQLLESRYRCIFTLAHPSPRWPKVRRWADSREPSKCHYLPSLYVSRPTV